MAILVPPEQVPIPKPDMATPAVDFIQNTQLETPQEREQRHNLFRQSISPAVLPKNPVLKTAPVPNTQTQSVVDPTDASSGMDYLASRFTSPEQEERYRKASVNRQRILAIGDALRHIGNIYNTVNYAPSQQFNDPIGTEYQRYQTDKNARDAANQRYISYQQAKAAQERKEQMYKDQLAKQERDYQLKVREADRKERYDQARIDRMHAQNAKDEATRAFYETRARLLEEGFPYDVALKKAREAQANAAAAVNNAKLNGTLPSGRSGGGGGGRRSSGGSSGGKYFYYDEDGNIHYVNNKTMYEQGVYGAATNAGISTTQNVTSTDAYGNKSTRTGKRSSTAVGADLANRAKSRRSSGSKGQSGRTSKGSKGPYSGFSIQKK